MTAYDDLKMAYRTGRFPVRGYDRLFCIVSIDPSDCELIITLYVRFNAQMGSYDSDKDIRIGLFDDIKDEKDFIDRYYKILAGIEREEKEKEEKEYFTSTSTKTVEEVFEESVKDAEYNMKTGGSSFTNETLCEYIWLYETCIKSKFGKKRCVDVTAIMQSKWNSRTKDKAILKTVLSHIMKFTEEEEGRAKNEKWKAEHCREIKEKEEWEEVEIIRMRDE